MARRKARPISDQGRKLLYLIETHRDRRPRSRVEGLAVGPDEGGRPSDYLSPIVTSPATLAQVLGYTDASSVSRWCHPIETNPIPARALARICRIYGLHELDFREPDYDRFVAICEGRTSSNASPSQSAASAKRRRLIAGATNHLAILTANPHTEPGRSRDPRDAGFASSGSIDPDGALPEVVQSGPFWIRLTSPRRDARRVWAGWHLLLFNHDVERDTFRMLMPRETSEATDWTLTYPAAASLDLPHRPVLSHPPTDHGRFAVVAVLSDVRAPRTCIGALSRETAHGPGIEATLEELAGWIEERIGMGRASVVSRRYRVMMQRA